MQTRHRTFSTALKSMALIGLAGWGNSAALAGVTPKGALVSIRVLYLEGIAPDEAQKLLRTNVGIAAISTFLEPAAVVLRDLPEQLDRSESLLRDRGAVVRAVEPHPPIVWLRPPETALQERKLRFTDADHADRANLVLRAIFGVKPTLAEGSSELIVRDLEVILDASEALFRELGFLADTTQASEG